MLLILLPPSPRQCQRRLGREVLLRRLGRPAASIVAVHRNGIRGAEAELDRGVVHRIDAELRRRCVPLRRRRHDVVGIDGDIRHRGDVRVANSRLLLLLLLEHRLLGEVTAAQLLPLMIRQHLRRGTFLPPTYLGRRRHFPGEGADDAAATPHHAIVRAVARSKEQSCVGIIIIGTAIPGREHAALGRRSPPHIAAALGPAFHEYQTATGILVLGIVKARHFVIVVMMIVVVHGTAQVGRNARDGAQRGGWCLLHIGGGEYHCRRYAFQCRRRR
mmetsp:Transcript_1026/g.2486  ORF Transcript_1026/g.2486 Transcript_1026/m.2486 type:complete len:274 (-) Transcript_1026:604-1425(-)